MLFDTVVGGATSVKNGINKGAAKHLMTQGINATDNIAKKGLKKSYKYYISQTRNTYLNEFIKDFWKDISKEIGIGVGSTYLKEKMFN